MDEAIRALLKTCLQAGHWLSLHLKTFFLNLQIMWNQIKSYAVSIQPETLFYAAVLCAICMLILVCLAKSLERPYSSYAGFIFYCVSIVLTALLLKLIIGGPEDLERIAKFNKENLTFLNQLAERLKIW